MIDYDLEFRRLAARERAAQLADDWRPTARLQERQQRRAAPRRQRAHNPLALALRLHHNRHAHRAATHHG